MAIAVALALFAGSGLVGWWWHGMRQSDLALDSARSFAAQVADDLQGGRPLAGLDGAPDAEEMATLLEGMGKIPHAVTVAGVDLDEDRKKGVVTLNHEWRVHADKTPWAYPTTVAIERDGESWRSGWDAEILVPGLREGENLRARRLLAARGEILGDGDASLVTARPVVRIGIDRGEASSKAAAARSARTVARLVDVDQGPFVAAVVGAGPKAFVEAITLRADTTGIDSLSIEMDSIDGARVIEDVLPLAPSSTFARPILGSVGPATAEQVEQSKGAVRAGDIVGLGGLQAAQNKRLQGIPGYVVEAVKDDGSTRELHAVDAKHGQSVRTTLSEEQQSAAEATLAHIKPASAIVAIRPSDGHVLAAASGPGSKGYSTATLGQYAPGSTFKAVTALALLRNGLTPQSSVPCTTTTTADGRSFKNYDNYPATGTGNIPFATAFANSCNTAFIAERDRLAPDSLWGAAASLGLTQSPQLGVPSALGDVPDADTEVDLAAAIIGQGKVLATPLGMATVAASIQHGSIVTPRMVLDAELTPTPAVVAPLTPAEGEQVRSLMRGVVTQGSATFLADVPGGPVLAKTGTAEYGTDSPPKTHAWMIGIHDDLAVAVFVEDGAGGASTAGPLLEDFLRRIDG
ncbi:cell division protein FtsI/penicillin-binding protein 2 [Kineosphaera limosa]|uniref:Putative penicillin-binding protein n=1 Tax=Kineosphaera limosa NBRC 100340 TaxID=1184609 RepID=K6VDS0_9MICO|nr:penicillin-binding transpeptidase domain-containing protein [Kineosphaera limosa]NYE02888.1 cell division protein FtsI/penicillin-binding protein 2 [Kineosphaera limosa]GAB94318.1 putative penicillin-binding protein [Kineosphaera limosa NBRC 100340]